MGYVPNHQPDMIFWYAFSIDIWCHKSIDSSLNNTPAPTCFRQAKSDWIFFQTWASGYMTFDPRNCFSNRFTFYHEKILTKNGPMVLPAEIDIDIFTL